MSCKTVYMDNIGRVKCGEFMFVYKDLNFDESVEFCKNQNYQLAKIEIKQGEVISNVLQYSHQFGGFVRIGLKFLKKNGTWSGEWADGENMMKYPVGK